jgi:hypothetical protein
MNPEYCWNAYSRIEKNAPKYLVSDYQLILSRGRGSITVNVIEPLPYFVKTRCTKDEISPVLLFGTR